jgi:DNA-binding transcriptional MerR regulator
MRIAELSQQSGVPVPTIKYYLREGLLPPGEFTSPNQARYGEPHVRRLRLVRALVDVGKVPIAAIRELLTYLDQPEPDLHKAIGSALEPGLQRERIATADLDQACADLDELIARRDWRVNAGSPPYQQIAEVMATMRQLGTGDLLARIDEYADAADRIAEIDLALVQRRGELHQGQGEEVVYGAVIGTIIGDALLQGLRRLAQENASARSFGIQSDCDPPQDESQEKAPSS